jgi:hypothetical protein
VLLGEAYDPKAETPKQTFERIQNAGNAQAERARQLAEAPERAPLRQETFRDTPPPPAAAQEAPKGVDDKYWEQRAKGLQTEALEKQAEVAEREKNMADREAANKERTAAARKMNAQNEIDAREVLDIDKRQKYRAQELERLLREKASFDAFDEIKGGANKQRYLELQNQIEDLQGKVQEDTVRRKVVSDRLATGGTTGFEPEVDRKNIGKAAAERGQAKVTELFTNARNAVLTNTVKQVADSWKVLKTEAAKQGLTGGSQNKAARAFGIEFDVPEWTDMVEKAKSGNTKAQAFVRKNFNRAREWASGAVPENLSGDMKEQWKGLQQGVKDQFGELRSLVGERLTSARGQRIVENFDLEKMRSRGEPYVRKVWSQLEQIAGNAKEYGGNTARQARKHLKGLRTAFDQMGAAPPSEIPPAAKKPSGGIIRRTATAPFRYGYRGAKAVAGSRPVRYGVPIGLAAAAGNAIAGEMSDNPNQGFIDSTMNVGGNMIDHISDEVGGDYEGYRARGLGALPAGVLAAGETLGQGVLATPALLGEIADFGQGLWNAGANVIQGRDANFAKEIADANRDGGGFANWFREVGEQGANLIESRPRGPDGTRTGDPQTNVEATKPGLRANQFSLAEPQGYNRAREAEIVRQRRADTQRQLAEGSRMIRDRDRNEQIRKLTRQAARGGKRGLAAASALQSITGLAASENQADASVASAEARANASLISSQLRLDQARQKRVDGFAQQMGKKEGDAVARLAFQGDPDANIAMMTTATTGLYKLLQDERWGFLSDRLPPPDANFWSDIQIDPNGTLLFGTTFESARGGGVLDNEVNVSDLTDLLMEEYGISPDQATAFVTNLANGVAAQ